MLTCRQRRDADSYMEERLTAWRPLFRDRLAPGIGYQHHVGRDTTARPDGLIGWTGLQAPVDRISPGGGQAPILLSLIALATRATRFWSMSSRTLG